MVKASEVHSVTLIEITLPDELAQRARKAGLLSDSAIQSLLEDAIRRRAGHRLLEAARGIHDAGIPPLRDDEIIAEVRAVRAGRRATETEESTPTQAKPVDEMHRS
jgi:post-segregation antitoxin (ccd killing protein)